ncbi:MAG: hypothetical protein K0Q95_2889 [Bacteroidota bacterium]|nr:hypothetical protein [Bacteroidota bacterium]
MVLLIVSSIPVTVAFQKISLDRTALRVEKRKATSGNNYTIFYKDDLMIDVSLKRPQKDDPSVLMSIPAAFTEVVTIKPDGLFIDHGIVFNRNKINHTLGGAVKMIKGDCEIFPSNKGKLLNDSLINHVASLKGSLFQQIQLIEKGKGARFKDVKEFQRRAIVKIKNKTAIIESFEHITLAAFTSDLLGLGITDALYTDMGSWDEGWYKKNGEVITIGRIRTQTAKQCNWVIFKNK